MSVGRIADDLSVNYDTAARALDRAVKAGYLAVEKRRGTRSKWQLTSRVGQEVTSRSDGVSNREHLLRRPRTPPEETATKDSLDSSREDQQADVRPTRERADARPVENLPVLPPDLQHLFRAEPRRLTWRYATIPLTAAAMTEGFSPGSGRIEDWTQRRPDREPASDADTARLWLEYFRRQLGRPTMPDDEYERLGQHVFGVDPAF